MVMWQKVGSMNNEQYSYIFDEKKKSLSVGQNVEIYNTSSNVDGMFVKVLNCDMSTIDAPTIIVGGDFSDGSLAINISIFCVK